MPATILPFVRPDITGREPEARAADAPEAPALPVFRPRTAPTSRQIAHRWAMPSHLARQYPRHTVFLRRVAARSDGRGPSDPLG